VKPCQPAVGSAGHLVSVDRNLAAPTIHFALANGPFAQRLNL
jgi:hypothetical protein